MLQNTLYPVIATILVSLSSFIGIFTISLNEKTLHKVLTILLAYSAGTILGAHAKIMEFPGSMSKQSLLG